MPRNLRTSLALAASAAIVLALAACGRSASTNDNGDALTKDGKLIVAVDATYPPNESVAADGKTVEGMDIDLVAEIAKRLNLELTWVKAPFDSIIPGIKAGKYTMGASSFTDNVEREKEVDFINYYSAGTSWVARAAAEVDPDNACGKTVAVQQGTIQVDDAQARSKACTDAGKPALNIKPFEAQTDATLAVTNSKADAFLADSPVAGYAVKQSGGALALMGEVYGTAPYGFAVDKGHGALAEAIQGALQNMIVDGTYTKILTKWGGEAGAVTSAAINAAGQK